MPTLDQHQQHINGPQTNIAGSVNGDVYAGPVNIQPPPVVRSLYQIPAPPADFVGREDELEQLLAQFQRGAAISGVRGMGGVGKSTLAFKLAQQVDADYPDAQVYVDLRGARSNPLTPVDAMQQVARAFHPEARLPDDEAEMQKCYRSVLHGKRALLLLDDAADREQVEALLPPEGCAALITSRQTFTLPGLKSLSLDALPPERARELLLEIAERIGAYADELAAACGYLPLALRAVGSALAERVDVHPAEYLHRLQQADTRRGLIEASLSLSYELLSPELQQRWAALAVFPADFDAPAAAAVLDVDAETAREALGALLRYSLLQFIAPALGINPQADRESGLKPAGGNTASNQSASAPLISQTGDLSPGASQDAPPGVSTGRYRLHDLARVYAAARLTAERDSALRKHHAAYYETVLRTANKLYMQGHEHILRGLALFDRERAHIEQGQQWAAANAAGDDEAAQLCSAYPDAGVYVLELRLTPRQRIPWLEAALEAARHLNHRAAEGWHLGNLGLTYLDLGEPRQAIEYHEQSLEIARAIGDRRGEGNSLGNLGSAYYSLGEPRRAIEYYEQRIEIAQEIGDRRGEGAALGNLGIAYRNLGEPRRAIDYYEQHVEIAQAIGDRRGEGNSLWNMSLALDDIGERAQAMACAEAALTIREQIEDPNTEKVRRKLTEWRRSSPSSLLSQSL